MSAAEIYKVIHITAVVISISGFIIRGYWRLTDTGFLQQKIIKVAPHIVDTILLLSAVLLAINTQQYPITHNWLTAKVVALVVYILLGMVTLRIAHSFAIRLAAYISAIMIFAYIIGVAMTKQVIPF